MVRPVHLMLAMTLALIGCNRGSDTPVAAAEPVAAVPSGVARSRVDTAAQERIGSAAPALPSVDWLGDAQSLEALRGRVVLIRFFTNTCPFCRTSAPALAKLDDKFRDEGLSVLGLYHPKPAGRDYARADVESFIAEFDWKFPVGLDSDWAALDRYWPPADRSYTSFSVLIDRQGKIRFIHPGPEFHPNDDPEHRQCNDDYADIERSIVALLGESAAAS